VLYGALFVATSDLLVPMAAHTGANLAGGLLGKRAQGAQRA